MQAVANDWGIALDSCRVKAKPQRGRCYNQIGRHFVQINGVSEANDDILHRPTCCQVFNARMRTGGSLRFLGACRIAATGHTERR